MDSEDITLPIELAHVSLSLEEIGTLFVLMSLPSQEEKNKLHWERNEQLTNILNNLMERGIIIASNSEDGLNLEIDLSILNN